MKNSNLIKKIYILQIICQRDKLRSISRLLD